MTTTTLEKRGSPRLPANGIFLLVAALVGIGVAWGLQLSQGMQVTGLSQQVSWGLYIAGFFVAAGAGGGLVTLSAVGEFSEALPVSRRRSMLLLALGCFAAAGVLIAMDLGHPLNTWRIATAGRFSSLMTWDFWALAGSAVLALVYLLAAWKEQKSTATTRVLGALAALAALGLVVAESWMLSVLAARPLWGGGLTLISFLASGAVAALAAGLLAWKELAPRLSRWLGVALGASLVLVLAEVLTLSMSAAPRVADEVSVLFGGRVAPIFWLHVLAGVGLPLAVLIWGKGTGRLPLAAGLALLGVLAHKLWVLVLGQTVPWLALPQGNYWPTWVEYVGVIGAVALVGAVYLVVRSYAGLDEA